MAPMEPLDHYGGAPQADATATVQAELDTLARVALASAETLARTAANRGARKAQATADAAMAEMGSAAADLATTRTDGGWKGPGTGLATLSDLLEMSAVGATPTSSVPSATAVPAGQDTSTQLGVGAPGTTAEPCPAAPSEGSGLEADPQLPTTLAGLLATSHPVGIQDELTAAQLTERYNLAGVSWPLEARTEIGLD